MTAWTAIDKANPRADRRSSEKIEEALELLNQLTANHGFDNRMRSLREFQDEGLRAASYDQPSTDAPLWCDQHAVELRSCNGPLGLHGNCTGSPYPHQDKMAERAVGFHGDKAEADAGRIHVLVNRLASVVGDLVDTLREYPEHPHQGVLVKPESDGDWCSHCAKVPSPSGRGVILQPTKDGGGRVRYRGLCQFCGDFRAAHGVLPHAELVKMHEAQRRIHVNDIQRWHPGLKVG